MVTRNQLRDRYRDVMDRVSKAAEQSGRSAKDILVVAVTKYSSPEQIRQIIELGHVDLGESRVQQLAQRVAMTEEFVARHRALTTTKETHVPDSIRWHMIGHLQRNKVKSVLPLVQLVHSVDSLRLAEELQVQAARQDLRIDVLLQVNVAEEKNKSGIALPAVSHMAEQMTTMHNLRVRGVMVMAPRVEDPEKTRPIFVRTAEIFHEVQHQKICGDLFNILSMGMSNDFEVAIESGANLVRIGRGFFGEQENESQ